MNLNSISELNDELRGAITNLAEYHTEMQAYCDYYEKSAFFPRKSGEKSVSSYLYDNYLQVFADKNIQYTSRFPITKVDPTPDDKEFADIREKIILGVHRKSGVKLLQKKFARDATKKSIAVAETYMNHKDGCVEIKRHDPRHVFYKVSNASEQRVTAFWAVYPITKKEAKERYGVEPEKDTITNTIQAKFDPYFKMMDGQEWFTMAIRWDDTHRVTWIGDKMVEEPHEHGMKVIPVDVCAPFPSESKNKLGSFYLQRLVPLQAELNDVIRRRSNIVKRYSNPIVWARHLQARTYDDVKQALKDAETGIIGLGSQGEVGILQLQEIKTLYDHEAAIKADMQRLSGFAAASFGESVGANTSGDALGMYFTPTEMHIEDQYTSWVAFWESINAKILHCYDMFGRGGRIFTLEGYHPRSTILSLGEGASVKSASNGNYRLQFDYTVIDGNYLNRVIMPTVTPKNEIEEKRLVKEAVDAKFISRSTGWEMWGIESPEDEKKMLMSEQAEPILNPDGTNTILNSLQQPAGGAAASMLPAPPALGGQNGVEGS